MTMVVSTKHAEGVIAGEAGRDSGSGRCPEQNRGRRYFVPKQTRLSATLPRRSR